MLSRSKIGFRLRAVRDDAQAAARQEADALRGEVQSMRTETETLKEALEAARSNAHRAAKQEAEALRGEAAAARGEIFRQRRRADAG